MSEYKADPALIDIPLQVSELEELAANGGKAIGKDQRKLAHFVQRVYSTVRMYKGQIQALHRDVQEIGLRQDRAGAASTLSPLDAVQYLSDTQLEELFGRVARDQLKFMRRSQTEAQAAAREARALIARIRFEMTGMLEDSTLPAAVRARLEAALQATPEPPPIPADVAPPATAPRSQQPRVATAPPPPPPGAPAAPMAPPRPPASDGFEIPAPAGFEIPPPAPGA